MALLHFSIHCSLCCFSFTPRITFWKGKLLAVDEEFIVPHCLPLHFPAIVLNSSPTRAGSPFFSLLPFQIIRREYPSITLLARKNRNWKAQKEEQEKVSEGVQRHKAQQRRAREDSSSGTKKLRNRTPTTPNKPAMRLPPPLSALCRVQKSCHFLAEMSIAPVRSRHLAHHF